MTDNDTTKAEAKLRKLGERVRAGWHQVHPLDPKHLAAVRAAVRQQWEQEHAGKSVVAEPETRQSSRAAEQQQSRQASKTTRPRSSRSQDHSQDHGHGY